jgi:hypothetical protein
VAGSIRGYLASTPLGLERPVPTTGASQPAPASTNESPVCEPLQTGDLMGSTPKRVN